MIMHQPIVMRCRSERGVLLAPSRLLAQLAIVACVSYGAVASAQPPPPTKRPSAAPTSVVPASAGQHMLVARIEGREVLAQGCRASSRCEPDGGERFSVPDAVRIDKVTSELIVLDAQHRALLLSFAPNEGPGNWALLLAASPRQQAPAAQKLVSGFLQRPSGQAGARRTAALLRDKQPSGTQLTVARSYDNATVCGRQAWMNARQLNPTTLQWEPAPTRSLSPAERAAATPLSARRSAAGAFDTPYFRLIEPTVASSALMRNRSSIGDHDLTTRWAEAQPDQGSGEFVAMALPPDVAVTAVTVAIRPRGNDTLAGAAPRTFILATRDQLFRVTMPEDAWLAPAGSAYRVEFPQPVRGDCLALVLEQAYGDDHSAPVGVAEIRAHSSWDRLSGDYAKLVEQLDGPRDQVAQAKALLLRGGADAVRAASAGYDSLPRKSRSDVLAVIDAGSCADTAPFFAQRLLGKGAGPDFDPDTDPLAAHARDRLRGCSSISMPLLVAAMNDGVGQERAWAASQLALMSPLDAARAIPSKLAEPQPDVRRELRKALALAAKHRRAKPILEQTLADPDFAKQPIIAQVDLLRALGDSIAEYDAAGPALSAALASDDSFRTRYLLLEPAARLAAAGDRDAAAILRTTIANHKNPHMRAHATQLAGAVGALSDAASGALSDRHPRVRAAALAGLSNSAAPFSAAARAQALNLLKSDPWTFVRADAARAIAARPPDPSLDEALIAALDDPAWPVRQAVLHALGGRNSRAAAERIHAIADDANEATDVRAAAISALGQLCHRPSAELLYKLALLAGYPQLPYDQPLGLAALAALGDIKPPDLARKLAPLLARDPRIARIIQSITRDVLKRPGRCPSGGDAI